MPTLDPRIDAYIAKSAAFAQPILTRLRETVHAACPDVVETIKWSMPFFDYAGAPLCNMAAFKAHAAFGFWKGSLVLGDTPAQVSAMGQFGRIESIDDLPDAATLAALIAKAMAITDSAAPAPRPIRHSKPPVAPPDDLVAALADNPAAQATFDGFSTSNRREYVEWIEGAKRPETRAKRLADTIAWLAEGKTRNWKYENC